MKRLIVLLGLALGGLSTAEPPPAADPAASGQLRLAQEEPQAEPEEDTGEEKSEKQPEVKNRAKAPPERFIPSEKISADSAVSFPVDI